MIAILAVAAGCATTPRQNDPAYAPDRIQKLQLSRTDGRYEVRITGQRKPTFTVFRLVNPMRIVVDLANYDVRPLTKPREIEKGEISRIRARQFGDESLGIGRLELTLRSLAEFESRVEGNSVVLTITPDRPDPRTVAALAQADDAELLDDSFAEDEVILDEEFIEDVPDEELFGDDDLFGEVEVAAPQDNGDQEAAEPPGAGELAPDDAVREDEGALIEEAAEEPAEDSAEAMEPESEDVVAEPEAEAVSDQDVEPAEGEVAESEEAILAEEAPLEPETDADVAASEAESLEGEEEAVEAAPVEPAVEADVETGRTEEDLFVEEPAPVEAAGTVEAAPVQDLAEPVAEEPAPIEEDLFVEEPAPVEAAGTVEAAPVQDLAEPVAEEPAPIEEDLFGEEAETAEIVEDTLPVIEEVDEKERLAQETLQGLEAETIEQAENIQEDVVIQASQLTDLSWEQDGDDLVFTIQANGPFGDYNAFKLENPARIVVDVWNVDSLIPGDEFSVAAPQISKARIGVYPEKVRVVLDVNGETPPEFTAEKQNDRLVLRVKPLPQPAVESPEVAALAAEPAEPEPVEIEVDGQAIEPDTMEPVEQPTVAGVEEIEEPEIAEPDAPNPAPTAVVASKEVEKEEEVEPMPQPRAANVGARPIALRIEQQQRPLNQEGLPQKQYRGRKINLDFKDADIDSVLRLIAEVSNLNIVTDEEVSGTISIRLVNVPWDQALDVVLAAKQLGMRKLGNIVRVAPLEKLQAEDEARLKALEDQELLLPVFIRVVPVNYADASEVAERIRPLLSERGNVDVDKRTNVLIIKDIKRNLDDAVTLVRSLDSPTPQVLIEAKIVEANTTFTRELGVQWGYGGNFAPEFGNRNLPGRFGVAGGSAGNFSPDGVFPSNQPVQTPNLAVDLPAAVGTGSGGALGFVFGSLDNSTILDLRLSAMESSGEGRIISSPRITTLDNEKAKISQGISIPFQTVSANGTQTQFVDAALQLEVTPHITPDRSVLLEFKISKNAPDSTFTAGTGVPSISKKEAESRMLVADGETAVIGGIFTLDKGHSISAVPWFSKIPVIGWFFKKKQTRETKTELLLFITPRVVVD